MSASAQSFFGPGGVARIAYPLAPPPRVRVQNRDAISAKAVKASASTYTIVDEGSPTASEDSSYPVAFNNSGQMIGIDEFHFAAYLYNDCAVFSSNAFAAGGTFIDLSGNVGNGGLPLTPGCTPTALSGPDKHGGVVFVGNNTSAFKVNTVAFASYVLRGKVTTTQFSTNDASTLGGVNVAGEAVGQASYLYSYSTVSSGTGWQFKPNYAPALFVKPIDATSLAVAQPACTTTRQYCAFDLWAGEACGFGGCTINDAGTIVAEDRENGRLMTFAYGNAAAKDIPIAASSVSNVMINDADQLALTIYDSSTQTHAAYMYSLSTAKVTKIPVLPANTCKTYGVISLNNKGRVLGYTSTCSRSSDQVYWTWDPANGIKNVTATIAPNAYAAIQALGLNDNGQILVALFSTEFGTADWGILKPPSSLASGVSGGD